MKNFRSIRILLALLLSLCMLFSGIPVFAVEDSENHVTAALNDEGNADVTVTLEDVEGEGGTGIRVIKGEDLDVNVDGFDVEYEEEDGEGFYGNLIYEEVNTALQELDAKDVSSLTVTADSITENVTTEQWQATHYDEHVVNDAAGIDGNARYGMDMTFAVEGEINVTVQGKSFSGEMDPDQYDWTYDNIQENGISLRSDEGNITLESGDVNVSYQYTDTDPETDDRVYGNINGIQVCMNDDDVYEHLGAPEGDTVEGNVSTGNVTVSADAEGGEVSLALSGIETLAGAGSQITMEAGDVTIKASITADDITDEELAEIIDGESASVIGATGVQSYGDSDVSVGNINVEIQAEGKNVPAHAEGVIVSGEENETKAESVSVSVISEAYSEASGINAEDNASVEVSGAVSVEAEGKTAQASGVKAEGSSFAETGSITVRADSEEGFASASGVYASDSYVEVSGGVEAGSSGAESNALAVQAQGSSKVVVHGDVIAEAESTDPEAAGYAVGIRAAAVDNAVTTVIAAGDVTAEAGSGVGIEIESVSPEYRDDESGKDASEKEAPVVNVLVDGTVSGPETAIRVTTADNFSTEDVNLTLWAAEENEDGQIAAVYSDNAGDGYFELNEEATTALEKAINYIVKFAAGLTFDAITTQKGNTVEFLDEKYHTANEDELVSVKASDTDEKELSGIFYNAEDESTLQEVKDLNKDENGNYQIRMKRGGGMQLGLQWHTHIYDTREKDRVEPTCTEDGSVIVETYCTQCGKVAVTETKVLPKGHTPGEAKKENETAATCKAEGSYDMVVRCSVCNEIISSEHFVTEKLEHTPGEAVRENEVPATERTNGSYDEVIYCTACGAEISRETKVIPKLQDTDSGNNNQNGSKKTTADLLEVVIVVADEQSDEVLSLVDDAGKTGNILSFLPDEIKDEIPADFSTVKTRNAMKIVGDIEEAVSFDAVFEFETPFTAGDTVYLLIAFTGDDGQTTWYLLKGEANKDGNVVANLTSLLSILGNQQFVVLTVTK